MDLNSDDDDEEEVVEVVKSDHDEEEVEVLEAEEVVPVDCPPSTSTALAVHSDPLLQRLIMYLEAHGGSASLVAGWRTRTGKRRSPGSGKTHDWYFYDESNTKFRAMKEVAEHFGLVDVGGRHALGDCPPALVDAKLWAGASAQGWQVYQTRDGHNTYTAPDGRKFGRKTDAQAWQPGGPPPKKRRRSVSAAPAVDNCAPLLLKQQSEASASTTGGAPASVRAGLARIGLEQYAHGIVEELGYDDVDYLLTLDEPTLLQVAQRAEMKVGHARKFAEWFKGGHPG